MATQGSQQATNTEGLTKLLRRHELAVLFVIQAERLSRQYLYGPTSDRDLEQLEIINYVVAIQTDLYMLRGRNNLMAYLRTPMYEQSHTTR